LSNVRDFRVVPSFDIDRINRNGRYVGRTLYWKLYFVENALRIIINSVLSTQVNPDWWEVIIGQTMKNDVERVRRGYLARPWHTYPGRHGIYYLYLHSLGDIMRDHAQYFLPIIPEVDQWVVKIEQIRLPRNVVGHMNFLSRNDRRRIDSMYYECKGLVRALQSKENFVLKIPEI
jgi:hypothetical protein